MFALGFLIFLTLAAGNIQAAYLISSLEYQISPSSATGKIGDEVLFQMCVLNAGSTYSNVSQVVSVTTTSITVACADFPASAPATIFVFDGIRTWRVTAGYSNPTLKSVQLTNTNLIAGTPLTDYTSLQYATFSAADGTTAGGAPAGSAKVDIGTSIYGINLYDDGGIADHNDSSAGDGIYNARFSVREAYQFNIKNGNVVGHFNNVSTAVNDPFISPNTISLDSVRPKVELVNASPNPCNPNTELAQFFYYLTENSLVQLDIKYYNEGLGVFEDVKTVTVNGYFGYNPPILWDGLSRTGVLQADGDYTYEFRTTDSAGNTGAVYTGVLKLTTVEIITNLYSVDSNYSQLITNQVVVTAKMNVELRNATLDNLRNLGFDYPTHLTYDPNHYYNYPWIYIDLRFYDISGTPFTQFPADRYSLSDTDIWYTDLTSTIYSRQFSGYTFPPIGATGDMPLPGNECAAVSTVIYTTGDGRPSNDWDVVFMFPLDDQTGGIFTSDPVFVLHSSNMSPGTYIMSFKGILVGKMIYTDTGIVNAAVDCPSGTSTTKVNYSYIPYHAQPSYFFDADTGVLGDERGYGLSSQLRTASFMVEQPPTVPLPDSTAPSVVPYSEYPSNNMKVLPGVIKSTNAVKITLTDDGAGAGPVNLSTFVLKDPYGNQVPGTIAWNAGNPGTKNWEIYYVPDNEITLGGIYTYTVVPVDAAYNIGSAVTYSFEIIDTSMPTINSVTLLDSAKTSTKLLTQSTSTQVDFPVSYVQTMLISGGTADVDWAKCDITVKIDDGTGNTVTGVITHEDGTAILEFVAGSQMMDGKYSVEITAVSDEGYDGAEVYNFYISTKDAVCIDLNGATSTVATDLTYMRMSPRMSTTTGIKDSGNNNVEPLDFSVFIPATVPANGSNVVLSTPVRVSVTGHNSSYPITFNSDICPTTMRLHYTDSDVTSILNAIGLTEDDLEVWMYNGSSWTRLTNVNAPVASILSDDRYIEFPLTTLNNAQNIYALMYLPDVTSPVVYHFNNTKAFNPSAGPARIFYTQDILSIGYMPSAAGNVRVGIYSMNGAPVRTLEYQNTGDYGTAFNPLVNSDPDPTTGLRYYYFTWDGLNDRGSLVRNGIYVVKIEVTTAAGVKSTLSRTIAVIK